MKVKGGAKRRSLGDGTEGEVANFGGSESGATDEGANVDDFIIGDVGAVGNGEEKGPSAVDMVGGGEEEGEEEGEDEGEGDEGEEEEQEEEEEEEDNGEDQRPKLAEGFYEIEAVRRKRVRKGEVQYLIKWQGWPETANTWEPLENLSSCVDVVEAFEERLQFGKSRSSRKRKRKTGTPHAQPRKKHHSQPSQSAFTAYDSGPIENSFINKIPTSLKNSRILEDAIPLQTVRFGRNEVTKSDSRDVVSEQSAEKVARNSLRPFSMRDEESGYDPKLSELRGGTCCNGFAKDSSTMNVREAKGSGGNEPPGTTRIDSVDSGQSSCQVGARRRKCNSVKRFKQELAADSWTAQNGFSTTAYNMNPETNNSKSSPIITQIIKPIGFSASIANNIQDVSVTFMAIRSDGKEVMVDNNFLKANYPLLLIDFYEQHLRYSPTS